MDLYCEIRDNPKVLEIVAKFSRTTGAAADDVITAFNQMVLATGKREDVDRRIEKVYLMCTHLDPAPEDVISMLLHIAHVNLRAGRHAFDGWFRKKRAERYFDRMFDAVQNAPALPEMTGELHAPFQCRADQIDYYIMVRACEHRYELLFRQMKERASSDVSDIFNAFQYAKKAYYWYTGPSGEPYLVHPLAVACILAEMGAPASVVAGAMLYDVAEVTGASLASIGGACGMQIVQYVQAVSSLQREYESSHSKSTYDGDRDMTQFDLHSFYRLSDNVANDTCKRVALFIKAAERIRDLRAMDRRQDEHKHDKTDETELDYLPLLKQFELYYFINLIQDLSWRVHNREYYQRVSRVYHDMLERNRPYIKQAINHLKTVVDSDRLHSMWQAADKEGGTLRAVVSDEPYYYYPLEVYQFARRHMDLVDTRDLNKGVVPICDFDVVIEPANKLLDFMRFFVKEYSDQFKYCGRAIINYEKDAYDRYVFWVEDEYHCKFRICISSKEKHENCRGKSRVDLGASLDRAVPAPHYANEISIRLRNGDLLALPQGATVIDVAYAIHPEVGMALTSATINGDRVGIYNLVHDGDRVIVESETRREKGVTKQLVPHVSVYWIMHVATDYAKRHIVRQLGKLYEGDDARLETVVSDAAISKIAEASIRSLGAVGALDLLD